MVKTAAKPAAKAARAPVARRTAKPVAAVKTPAAAARKPAALPTPPRKKPAKEGKPAKAKKVKLVRDSFTLPEPEYETISRLKKRCLKAGLAAKKSEILRAAVASLAALTDAALLATVRHLKVIKTGRPAKGSK